jgi:argininosuccinate lyase
MSKLWGGRFEGDTDSAAKRLNDSLPFDQRLWREDIEGSIAHATMLGEAGIIAPEDAVQITEGLKTILGNLETASIALPEDAEDIHAAIESLLKNLIGQTAGKLHTARSRNDQVATDLRLFIRRAIDDLDESLRSFQSVLISLAEQELDTIMPGYTHLQRAQPVLLSHHLLAYFWMLQRDRERLTDARKRVNVLPLGSGALAGTTFPIDRQRVADLLGFEAVSPNSLDAVSDRDFVIEFLAACSLISVHLSRLGEEIVLWNSYEFGFIELDDSVATGSSMMPQKKNPDVAELARGKTGRVIGHLVSLLTTMKGLPLAYNKDMQEDKVPVFDTIDTLQTLLPALARTLSTASFNRGRMAQDLNKDFSTVTDLADELVRSGLSFREAHEKVGMLVRECLASGTTISNVPQSRLAELGLKHPNFDLSARASISRRTAPGGTARGNVEDQVAIATSLIKPASGLE